MGRREWGYDRWGRVSPSGYGYSLARFVGDCTTGRQVCRNGRIGGRGGGPVSAGAWWDGERIRRGSVEWNEMGQLENHCYFGLRRAAAHAGLQMLMSLAAQPDQFLAEAGKGVARDRRQGWRASCLSDACHSVWAGRRAAAGFLLGLRSGAF